MLRRLILALALFVTPALAADAGLTRPDVTVWKHDGDSITTLACTRTVPNCVGGVVVRRGGKTLWRSPADEMDYSVRLGWSGKQARPLVAVVASHFTNGDDGAVVLVDFTIGKVWTRPVHEVGALTLKTRNGVPAFDDAIVVTLGAHVDQASATVPVVWRGGRFEVDQAALAATSFSRNELNVRALALAADLRTAASVSGVPVGYSGTVEALLPLMLSGRADQARQLLVDNWPGEAGKAVGPYTQDQLWDRLCFEVAAAWDKVPRGRLPNDGAIRAAAARWKSAHPAGSR